MNIFEDALPLEVWSCHFLLQLFFQASSYPSLIQEQYKVDKCRTEEIQHLLSWKSLVKNFSTLLQNFAERFSLAVAIMIWTSSPLHGEGKLSQFYKRQPIPFFSLALWATTFRLTSPFWEEFLHGFSGLAALQLFLQMLQTFLQDGLIQATEEQRCILIKNI